MGLRFDNDRKNKIGCGIGRFLPYLSTNFRQVLAIDISPKCIARSQFECSHLSNIKYFTLDLAAPRTKLPKADFALSVNSIISPLMSRRNRIFDAITKHLRRGSYLFLVVPALESALLTDCRLIEWNLRQGMKPKDASQKAFRVYRKADNPCLHEGIIAIEGVPTKYYLKEELVTILQKRRMKIVDIHKIEYSWKTEFTSPPRWMKAPFPWDWLFVAQKAK